MGFFARAIISGFGFSLGKALFDKVKDHIGLGDTPSATQNGVTAVEDAIEESDPTHGPAMELESLERAAN
ncbi:MAG TPA: hypothetical protein VNM90_00975 [Haliangium sp.]|nr:hypothetical protein [Haliangium sp.]